MRSLRTPKAWAASALICFVALGCHEKPKSETKPVAPAPNLAVPTQPATTPSTSGVTPGDAARGKELVVQFECSRCHDGTGVAEAPLEKHCVRCHQQIISGKFKAPATALAKWKPNVAHLRDVPSLTSIGRRLRPEWIEKYLLEPRDLRPNLTMTMPRLKLTKEQAHDIVTYLTEGQRGPIGPSQVEGGDTDRGHELFEGKGCGSCHVFSGVGDLATKPKPDEGSEAQQRGASLAPDLRNARERVRRDDIAAWIMDPKSIKPDTLMTPNPVSPPEARDIGAFILTGLLDAPPPKPAFQRLPVLTRRVSFAEVNDKVFMKICRHCHGDADQMLGDGGPGNTGGFGFKPRGINFSNYRGVMSGRINDNGERESLFLPLKDGTPRLLGALLARHAEYAGSPNPEVRGMPLGLPPLPAEQIQLVETWITQGRPP